MPSIRGHKLKIGKPKDGRVTATCSCKGWTATGTVAEVTDKWNKRHVNKFDTLRQPNETGPGSGRALLWKRNREW